MEIGKRHALGMGSTVVAWVLLIHAHPASANLIITVQENAGPVVPFLFVGPPTAGTSGIASTTTPHYDINVLFGLEQQLDPTFSKLVSADVLITKLGDSSDVLHVTVTGTDFTSPVTPPDVSVLSSVSATATYAGLRPGNSLTFQSTVGGTALGLQNPPITSTGSSSDNKTVLLHTLLAPFSIVQSLDFVLTNNGDQIRFGGNTILTQVPEPATGLLGLLSLALVIGRRRKARNPHS